MKVKISMTMSRTISLSDIRKEYGERMELEKDQDPVERIIEFMNDEGLDFFQEEEDPSLWDHNIDAVPVK